MVSNSPQSLVADARRHGVTVHGPDVNASLAHATLENHGLQVRLGWARCATSVTTWPSASSTSGRPTGRMRPCWI